MSTSIKAILPSTSAFAEIVPPSPQIKVSSSIASVTNVACRSLSGASLNSFSEEPFPILPENIFDPQGMILHFDDPASLLPIFTDISSTKLSPDPKKAKKVAQSQSSPAFTPDKSYAPTGHEHTPKTLRSIPRPLDFASPSSNTHPELATKLFQEEINLFQYSLPSHSITTHLISGLPFVAEKYTLSTNQEHVLIKQTKAKSCGPTVCLMLVMDRLIALSSNQRQITESLVKGFNTDATTNSFDISKILQESGFNPKIYYLNQIQSSLETSRIFLQTSNINDIKEHLNNLITKTNNPVIVSITHPQILGHWVIVDKVITNDLFIRDPYSGKAYRVSQGELAKSFQELLTENVFEQIITLK